MRTQEIEISEELMDLLTEERSRLMQAETILQCASIAFDYCDPDGLGRPYFPNVASVGASLIKTAIDNLDSVALRKL